MSTSGEGRQDGLSRVIKRMRTILRRNSTAKQSPASSNPASSNTKETPVQPESSKAPVREPTVPAQSSAQPIVFRHWSAIQEEKTRILFAKYGLNLEPGEWKYPSNDTVQRVTKPIRMRVHRTCHRCQTPFGPDKVCINCQHVRCKKCPRHSPSKSKDSKEQTEAALQIILAKAANPTPVQPRPKEPKLTIPSRTGGQDLVLRPVKQRVRRTCHRCHTLFNGPNATECSNCKHIRCRLCPREPPKLHKYPNGYPGDAEPPAEPPARTWKRPRQRVRYICHQCSNMYRSGERNCSNCGQERGPETIRDPPKKAKPVTDPDIVKKVEERLASIKVSGTE